MLVNSCNGWQSRHILIINFDGIVVIAHSFSSFAIDISNGHLLATWEICSLRELLTVVGDLLLGVYTLVSRHLIDIKICVIVTCWHCDLDSTACPW